MTRPPYPGLLLDDRFAPMTTAIGFVKAEADAAVRAFRAWREALRPGTIYASRFAERRIVGDLATGLAAMRPMSAPWRRFLFAPVQGGWTGIFGNSWVPNLSAEVRVVAGELRARGVELYADPNRVDGRKRATAWHGGGFMIDVYGPEVNVVPGMPPDADGSEPIVARHVRGLALLKETTRWKFDQFGVPLPFEDPAWFAVPGQKAKLTLETVRAYLLGLDIPAFDAAEYAPDGWMILRENQVPWPGGDETRTLEEAQAAMLS